MRRGALLLLLAAAAAGGEDRFEDPFWNVSFAAPGLRRGLPRGDPALLFEGTCDGPVRVEIRVLEDVREVPAAEWAKRARAEWEKAKRKTEGLAEGEGWVRFREKRLGVFDELHAYAFHARGYHCFEVHAAGEAPEAVTKALQGFAAGPDEGAALLAARLALRAGKSPLDPVVLLEAGAEYVSGGPLGQKHLPLAAALLGRARRLMREGTFTPEQLWRLYESGGAAHGAAPAEAAEWHRMAEEAAARLAPEQKPAERKAQSAYNLACALARAERVDDAFDALRRAYAETKPVSDAHLSDDRDLDNLRRDDRWHEVWKLATGR